MAQPGCIRSLGLAIAVASAASACARGQVGRSDPHRGVRAAVDVAGAPGASGRESAVAEGFDPSRFSRASALARVARVLAQSANRLSSDSDMVCAGSAPPPEYCAALQNKVAELRAMAAKALTACRRVAIGMLTPAGDPSLCALDPGPSRRVLVIQPVVP